MNGIVADISLLPTAEGGRHGPTPSNFHRCIFVFEGGNFDCALGLSETGAIAPGESARVTIEFLVPDLIVPRLEEGSNFSLREVRIIGHGIVVDV